MSRRARSQRHDDRAASGCTTGEAVSDMLFEMTQLSLYGCLIYSEETVGGRTNPKQSELERIDTLRAPCFALRYRKPSYY